jgi:hypothetical protein
MTRYGGSALEQSAQFRDWAERADRYAAPDTVERVYADHALAIHKLLTHETERAMALFHRALALARTLGHNEAIYRSADKCVHWVHSFDPEDAVLEIVREVRAVPRQGVRTYTLGSFLWWSAFRYLTFADRARTEELVAEIVALGERTRDPGLQWRGAAWQVVQLTLDGDLEGSLHARIDLRSCWNIWVFRCLARFTARTCGCVPASTWANHQLPLRSRTSCPLMRPNWSWVRREPSSGRLTSRAQ